MINLGVSIGKSEESDTETQRQRSVRTMKPVEKVLVLLPSDSSKLLMQWQGPYQIVKKISKVHD